MTKSYNYVYVESRLNGEVLGRFQYRLGVKLRIAMIQFRFIMLSAKFNGADTLYGQLENSDKVVVMTKITTSNQKPLPKRCIVQL